MRPYPVITDPRAYEELERQDAEWERSKMQRGRFLPPPPTANDEPEEDDVE